MANWNDGTNRATSLLDVLWSVLFILLFAGLPILLVNLFGLLMGMIGLPVD